MFVLQSFHFVPRMLLLRYFVRTGEIRAYSIRTRNGLAHLCF